MLRTKTNMSPNIILCSDFHLREDQPICRTDDFWEAQWKDVDFISDLQKKYNCPVIHAGDLFDFWKPSPYLLSEAMHHLPKEFYTIYGQHDLPQHSLELAYKCGINTLLNAGKLTLLPGIHWGQDPKTESDLFGEKILIWHVFNYQGKPPWPGCISSTASKLLNAFPQYDLIVTGDNHKSFVERMQDGVINGKERFRLLVNPGSLNRQEADDIDNEPRIYLWYADTNTVESVYIPLEPNVISREHIELKEERDARIEAFISRLDGNWEASLSFEQNLEQFEKTNSVRKSVMDIVYKAIGK